MRETCGFETGAVANSTMRHVGMGYRVARQTFGVLVLSCVLLTIWWVLVGGRLGKLEDEDDENDLSAGAGGGGRGVCEGGGGRGGEKSTWRLTGEESTGRYVEIGTGGEGM